MASFFLMETSKSVPPVKSLRKTPTYGRTQLEELIEISSPEKFSPTGTIIFPLKSVSKIFREKLPHSIGI